MSQITQNKHNYSVREFAVDTCTFSGATALANLASRVHLLSPLSIGGFLLAGADLITMGITQKLLDYYEVKSPLVRICAVVVSLALTTFALTMTIGTFIAPSVAILSLETAVALTFLLVATKVATYAIYKAGQALNSRFFSSPKQIEKPKTLPPQIEIKEQPVTPPPQIEEKTKEKKTPQPQPNIPLKTPSLWESVSKELTWKRAAGAGAVLAIALAASYYFQSDLIQNTVEKPVTHIAEKIGNSLNATQCLANLSNSSPPYLPTALTSIPRSICPANLPQGALPYLPKKLIPPLFSSTYNHIFSNVTDLITPIVFPKQVLSSSHPHNFDNSGWGAVVPGLLLALGLYRRFTFKKKPDQIPEEKKALNPIPKKQFKSCFVGITFEDSNEKILLDLENSKIRELLQKLHFDNLQELQGKTIVLPPSNKSDFHAFVKNYKQTHSLTPAKKPFSIEAPSKIEIEEIKEDSKKELNWKEIENYVHAHCPGVSYNKAKEKIIEGIQLIQALCNEEKVEQTDLENKLSSVCWGLMGHAISKGQAFVEGTFDIKDPGHRLFHFFLPVLYGRASSHYKKRIILFEKGDWSGYGHFGLDGNSYPAGKQTVMLGRIATRDGSDRTYLKMENYGANLNFLSDKRALPNSLQVVAHSFKFFESQLKRNFPVIFGEVGGGLNMRKEHMPNKHINIILSLVEKIKSHDPKISFDKDEFAEHGFSYAIPWLKELFNHPTISKDLKNEITEFIKYIENTYDNINQRKGNEVNVNDSILNWNLPNLNSQQNLIKDFEDFSPSEKKEETPEWKIAYHRLLGTDYLSNHTVMTFGNLLEKETACMVLSDFLSPRIDTNAMQRKIEKAVQKHPKNHPIFIPCVLESPVKSIPLVGNYFCDHIVVLKYENGTWEYYDSKGCKIKDETRRILGMNQTPYEFFSSFSKDITSNTTMVQSYFDVMNCGAYVCNYMLENSNPSQNNSSLNKNIDPIELRQNLAAYLKRKYDPVPFHEAKAATDIIDRLEFGYQMGAKQKSAQDLLKENAQYYFKEEDFDKEQIFSQVEKDLSRGHGGQSRFLLNNKVPKSAQEIYEALKQTGRNENEILSIMTLLQQGIFASAEQNMIKTLDITLDAGLQLRGQGAYLTEHYPQQPIRHYNLQIKEKNCTLDCSALYELIPNDLEKGTFRETPYAILKTHVALDLEKEVADESWKIDKIIR